jgi:hypothetical protein
MMPGFSICGIQPVRDRAENSQLASFFTFLWQGAQPTSVNTLALKTPSQGSMSAIGMFQQQPFCDSGNWTAFVDLLSHPTYHCAMP